MFEFKTGIMLRGALIHFIGYLVNNSIFYQNILYPDMFYTQKCLVTKSVF